MTVLASHQKPLLEEVIDGRALLTELGDCQHHTVVKPGTIVCRVRISSCEVVSFCFLFLHSAMKISFFTVELFWPIKLNNVHA